MTAHYVLHKVVPHEIDIAVTDEIKTKTTAYGDLIVLFAIGSRVHEVTILRCFVIPAIHYCNFSLAPIRRIGCKKFIYGMNDKD